MCHVHSASVREQVARLARAVYLRRPRRVEWHDDSVYLTGWAEVVCEGEWFRELPR